MLRLQTILALVLIFFADCAYSQMPVREFSNTYSILMANSSEGNKSHTPLLQELSKALQKSNVNVSYTIAFHTISSIAKISETNQSAYRISTSLKVSSINGDTNISGFVLENELKPTSINVEVYAKEGAQEVLLKVFSNIPLQNNQYQISEENTFSIQSFENVQLVLKNIQPQYSLNAVNSLKQKILYIQEYQNISSSLPPIQAKLNQIQTQNPETLEDNRRAFSSIKGDIEKYISLIESLSLEQNDPLNHKNALLALQSRYTQIKNLLDHASENAHELHYQKGMQEMNKGHLAGAEKHFKEALHLKPNYAPALIQIARKEYLDGRFEHAEAYLDKVDFSSLDENNRNGAIAVYADMYGYYIMNGDKFKDALQFEAAGVEFDKALEICNKNILPTKECVKELYEKNKEVKNNKFEYIISQAREDIYEDNLDKAEVKLRDAKNLQVVYSTEITDVAMLNDAFLQLSQAEVDKGNKALQNKKYEKAIEDFSSALHIVIDNNLPSNLISSIQLQLAKAKDLELQSLFHQSTMQANAHNYKSALKTLESARVFVNTHQMNEKDKIQMEAQKLYQSSILGAENEMKAKKFHKATENLEIARTISRVFSPINPSNNEVVIEKQIREGYLLATMQEIKTMRKEGKWAQVEAKISEMEKILQAEDHTIKSELVLERDALAAAYVSEAMKLMQSKQYERALPILSKAEKLQSKETPGLNKASFDCQIGLGVILASAKEYMNALNHSTIAESFLPALSSTERAASEKTLQQVRNTWMKEIVSANIQKAKEVKGQVELSGKIIAETLSLMKKYGYTPAAEQAKEFDSLKKEVLEKECERRNLLLKEDQKTALGMAEAGLFDTADKKWKEIIKTASEMPECGFPVQEVHELRKKYQDPIYYQDLIQNGYTFLEEENAEAAYTTFKNVEKYFTSHDLGKFGLQNKNSGQLIRGYKNDKKLHVFIVSIVESDPTLANELLLELQKRGYSDFMLQTLGEELAAKDFTTYSSKKSKEVIGKYSISGNKYFKKGYLERWKQLGGK